MLLGSSKVVLQKAFTKPMVFRCISSNEKVFKADNESASILRRGPGEKDITTMDLIEERIRRKAESRESTFGGQQQSWNYRSEVVGKLGLDNNHKNIWIAYTVIILFGFTAFVYVKSNVILSRKEEMEERERIRRELKLRGADRKKLGVVDSY